MILSGVLFFLSDAWDHSLNQSWSIIRCEKVELGYSTTICTIITTKLDSRHENRSM